MTGGADGEDDAIASALAAFNTSQLAVVYANDTTNSSNGEVVRLTRVQTGDGADDTMTSSVFRGSFIGGADRDTVNYNNQTANLVINLATNTATDDSAIGDILLLVPSLTIT